MGRGTTVSPGEWKILLKRLFIKGGSRGGLQYHRLKDEAGYIVSGKLMIRYQGDDGALETVVLNAGDAFHFAPGVIHQEEALEDTVVIEASTLTSMIGLGLKVNLGFRLTVVWKVRLWSK